MIPVDYRIRDTGYYARNEIVFFSPTNVKQGHKIQVNYGLKSLAGIVLGLMFIIEIK